MTRTVDRIDELSSDQQRAFDALARALRRRLASSSGFVSIAEITELAPGLGQPRIRAALRSMPRNVVVEVKRGKWAIHSFHLHLYAEVLNREAKP